MPEYDTARAHALATELARIASREDVLTQGAAFEKLVEALVIQTAYAVHTGDPQAVALASAQAIASDIEDHIKAFFAGRSAAPGASER